MNERTNEHMNEQMDGWTDGRSVSMKMKEQRNK